MKQYTVTAYNFEMYRPFKDDLNTEVTKLKTARQLAKKQAKQWCETEYGRKLVLVDLNTEKGSPTKTVLQKQTGKWKIKPESFFIEGYVCNDGERFGSAIKRNF